MKAFKVNQMLSEGFVAQLKPSVCGPQPWSDQRRSHHLSVEWNFVETSMEDGLLARAAVNRNDCNSHRYLDAKNVSVRISSIELKKELTDNINKDTNNVNDEDCSQHVSETKAKTYLPSIDFEALPQEDKAARIIDSLEDYGTSEAENNQARERNDPHEAEPNVFENHDWQVFTQDMKLRRRCGDFPPPLASLSGKSCSRLHRGPACVQLQRIRSKGRFVLQEVKTTPVLSFQPIRSRGRLVLQLIHRNGEDASVPMTQKLCVPTNNAISRVDSKVEISNYDFLSSQSEQSSDDISNNQQATTTDKLVESDDFNKKDLLPVNLSNKKESRESKIREDMQHLPLLNTTDNAKEPLKAYANIDDGKCLSENECLNRETHRRNPSRMPEELIQMSEFDFKHDATCSADFQYNNSSETTLCLDLRLPRKPAASNIGATPQEKGMAADSSSQFSAFRTLKAMRGVDSASNFQCQRSVRREENYIPVNLPAPNCGLFFQLTNNSRILKLVTDSLTKRNPTILS